jgi:hypothetical protein
LVVRHRGSYVGTAVPEGGVGGLPSVVEQLDVGVAALKDPSAECIEILCRVGDEVFLMLVVGIVWCNSFRGLASSSLLERLVFAPPIAYMASSLRLWLEVVSSSRVVLGALCPYYIGFSPVFY